MRPVAGAAPEAPVAQCRRAGSSPQLRLVSGDPEHVAVGADDDRHRFPLGQPFFDFRSRRTDEGEVEAVPASAARAAAPRAECAEHGGREHREHREPVPRHVVQPAPVGEPRLREHGPARRSLPHPCAASEPRLRKVERPRPARTKLGVARPGRVRVRGLDDRAEADRELDELAHVGAALGLAGVEQRFAGRAGHHHPELPGEVGGVPDAGAHALPEEGRGLVRAVPGQHQPAAAPRCGEQRMEGVDRGALDADVVRADRVGQHRPDPLGPHDPGFVVARHEHDLPAMPGALHVYPGHRPARVAVLDRIVGKPPRAFRPRPCDDVHDEPGLVQAEVDHRRADRVPDQ